MIYLKSIENVFFSFLIKKCSYCSQNCNFFNNKSLKNDQKIDSKIWN